MVTSSNSQRSRIKCLHDIDVAILAGGLGSRLQGTLDDLPKVLAPIGKKPFLKILLDHLQSFGARRVILALGHLAEHVMVFLEENPTKDVKIDYTIEDRPQGTAGAIRTISHHFYNYPVMVMNGDSFIDANLCTFRNSHVRSGAKASILCTTISDNSRFGNVSLDNGSRITSFDEKKANRLGVKLINGGVYFFEKETIEKLNSSSAKSLEREIFPNMLDGSLNGYSGSFRFIDIGTPESLKSANVFFTSGSGVY